jgi:hypothetical protein
MAHKRIRSQIINKLGQVSRDLSIFSTSQASVDQKIARSRFWARYASNPDLEVPSVIDATTASQGAADKRVLEWWLLPGFSDWFTNSHEFKERVEFLTSLALDSVEELLKDSQASPSARVAAIKIVLEIADKFPTNKKSDETYADERIQQMDQKELEQFIQSRLQILPSISEKSNADT